ncbi:bifunctional diaminohydroxyphosphoribosylaminopyrimidine deaminase/5-amino-6-(5-phosphoribosylamino)uracil reductase RibD [Salibacterium aidingense]|uniref:bifunctional diaminohydroxyphosphoribosylaminopyrimidine deaminase/5-amino-6-(5-phosphoribosylamino)uracil reductase RibD n=1 Tax=Salibacterium aidingense TaxID=384933 RepID=UPI00041C4C28|nr:bifunctional diaminohydroxyphosphoribosylaminopyrimidine deaminase/5-amino-6-(5-phosphoribosylamino)uracil reductase RibD [Salibacterium aidingense]
MTDEEYMRLALEMAEATTGQTSPNPVVGAVVVKDGKVAGMGAHLKAGEKHAEIHALTMAGTKAENSTIYVTLEPCSHVGKTPPCVDAIIENKVKRAVIATLDPNPRVSGTGVKKLEEAGLEVTTGVLQEKADWLNRYFFHYMKTGLPYVTLKTAVSLDGKTATAAGQSQWITGPEAREDTHLLRHQHDAIMAGIGTVLQDDPSLTARPANGGIQPVRVVLDHHLRMPVKAKMIQDQAAPVWIICSTEADPAKKLELEQTGAVVHQLPESSIHLKDVLRLLGGHGLVSVFVEGGAEVHGSFVEKKLFQEFISYTAPKLIGGREAPSAAEGRGIASLAEVPDLDICSVESLGRDIKITAVQKEEA